VIDVKLSSTLILVSIFDQCNVIIGVHDDSDHEIEHDGCHEEHDQEKVEPYELNVDPVMSMTHEFINSIVRPFSPSWEIDVEEIRSPLRKHKSEESTHASKLMWMTQGSNI